MPVPTLAQAIATIRAGRRAQGRAMLEQILAADPRNIMALLWMTEVAHTDEERREYLNRVLAIDPNNAIALKGLEELRRADKIPSRMMQAKPVIHQAYATTERDAAPSTSASTIKTPKIASKRKIESRWSILSFIVLAAGIIAVVGVALIVLSRPIWSSADGRVGPVMEANPVRIMTPTPRPVVTRAPTIALSSQSECDELNEWVESTLPNMLSALALLDDFKYAVRDINRIDPDSLYHISTQYYVLAISQAKMKFSSSRIRELNWSVHDALSLFADAISDLAAAVEYRNPDYALDAKRKIEELSMDYPSLMSELISEVEQFARQCGIDLDK